MTAPVSTQDYGWFVTLWPLAVIFHLAGNDWFLLNFTFVGALQIPLLIAAVTMLFRPTEITAALLSVAHLLVVSAKLPVVGNHEILLALIHFAVLIAVVTKNRNWLPAVVPPLRWVLLIAYSAIAFSKLNSGFVDRAVSCAVIFGDEFGDWVNVSVSNSAVLSYMMIALTIIFELAIPIMLMVRPLRRIGIVVGMMFHIALALEPAGHVFDFTSVLFVLFLLFLTPDASRVVRDRVQQARDGLGTSRMGLILAVMAIGNFLMFRSSSNGYFGPNWLFDWPIWLAYAAFLLRTVVPTARRPAGPPPKLAFRVAPAMAVVLLLTSLNAASPYVELRTAGAFNMYSNLTTNRGETNHFLLPGTLPIRTSPRFYAYEPVQGLPHSLDFYDDAGGFIVPEINLVDFTLTNPQLAGAQVQLVSEYGNPVINADPILLGDLADRYTRADRLIDRTFFIRAIDPTGDAHCRRYWGPAN